MIGEEVRAVVRLRSSAACSRQIVEIGLSITSLAAGVLLADGDGDVPPVVQCEARPHVVVRPLRHCP